MHVQTVNLTYVWNEHEIAIEDNKLFIIQVLIVRSHFLLKTSKQNIHVDMKPYNILIWR